MPLRTRLSRAARENGGSRAWGTSATPIGPAALREHRAPPSTVKKNNQCTGKWFTV